LKTGFIVLIAVLLAILMVGCGFIGSYNNLASEREAIRGEWGQVDTALQFRADLIPNLVETVKGYAKEETQAVQSVADARTHLLGAKTPQDKIDANQQLTGAVGHLLVIVENYPNLKASDNFKGLQRSLEGADNRILQTRRRYNDAVRKYNTDLSVFPGNLVASISGFQRDDAYFKTENDARSAPKVQF
jgi:LemA protein